MLISYERAKAESLGFDARGGLMERAERLVALGHRSALRRAAHADADPHARAHGVHRGAALREGVAPGQRGSADPEQATASRATLAPAWSSVDRREPHVVDVAAPHAQDRLEPLARWPGAPGAGRRVNAWVSNRSRRLQEQPRRSCAPSRARCRRSAPGGRRVGSRSRCRPNAGSSSNAICDGCTAPTTAAPPPPFGARDVPFVQPLLDRLVPAPRSPPAGARRRLRLRRCRPDLRRTGPTGSVRSW